MSNHQTLDLVKQGASASPAWKSDQPPGFVADLASAFQTSVSFEQRNLSRADLRHPFFGGVVLLRSFFVSLISAPVLATWHIRS